MNDKKQNLQDTFLNSVRKSKTPLTIYLVNGVKLQGVVDHHHVGVIGRAGRRQFLNLALAEQGGGNHRAHRRQDPVAHDQIQGLGQADGLFEPLLRRSQAGGPMPGGMDDDRGLDRRPTID